MSDQVTPPDWNEAQLKDWPCLFGDCGNSYPPEWLDVGPPAIIANLTFTAANVAEVIASHYHDDDGGSGEGNEPEIVVFVRFSHGRDTWGACEAGADYTGWGCQDSVRWWLGPTRESVERFGMTDEMRRKLGITLR